MIISSVFVPAQGDIPKIQRNQCSEMTLIAAYVLQTAHWGSCKICKYIQVSPCFIRKKNLTCCERDLGRRLRLEDDRFKASIDCLSKPSLQKAKEKGRKNGWMEERKEVRMASGQAARKERALQFWIHSSVYLPLKENVHAGSKGKTGWANIPNSR